MTSAWTSAHVLSIDPARADAAPLIGKGKRHGLADGIVYWDMWPIQQADGAPAQIAGRELWMALSAPDRGDPSLRHFEAKIRLLERIGGGWQDLGPVLPDFPVPYEREWAGSAMTDGERVSLFFTGAGTASRPGGYQQALFEAHGTIGTDGLPTGWSVPVPSTATSSVHYMAAEAHEGAGRADQGIPRSGLVPRSGGWQRIHRFHRIIGGIGQRLQRCLRSGTADPFRVGLDAPLPPCRGRQQRA